MDSIKLEIQGMIDKVARINNEFGVSKTQTQVKSEKDDFTNLHSEVAHLYYSTITKIDELTALKLDTTGNQQEVITIAKKENEINQEIKKINEVLPKLEKQMSKRNKKLSEEQRKQRQNIVQDLINKYKRLEAWQRGDPSWQEPKTKKETVEFKMQLFEHVPKDMINLPEPDEEEKQMIADLKKREADVDQILAPLGDKIEGIKNLALQIGDNENELDAYTLKIMNKVDDVKPQIDNMTKKVKEIIQSVRGPDKFCTTIILILVLLGLVAVGFNLIKDTI